MITHRNTISQIALNIDRFDFCRIADFSVSAVSLDNFIFHCRVR